MNKADRIAKLVAAFGLFTIVIMASDVYRIARFRKIRGGNS